MDTANSVSDVLYRLGFQSSGDIALSTSWVTVAELYQWADEAAQKIAYASGVFCTADASLTAIASTAEYALPASNVFTLATFLNGVVLRMTAVRDLWALDATWPATSGPATRASLDASGVGTITLYPVPTVGGTLTQIAEEYAPTIALATSTVALPTVLQDFFSYAMMAGARGKESDAFMPEVAQHFEDRMSLYESVIQHLYGPG